MKHHLLERIARLLGLADVDAALAATVPPGVTADDREDTERHDPQCGDEGAAKKPWRSCVCAIESDSGEHESKWLRAHIGSPAVLRLRRGD